LEALLLTAMSTNRGALSDNRSRCILNSSGRIRTLMADSLIRLLLMANARTRCAIGAFE